MSNDFRPMAWHGRLAWLLTAAVLMQTATSTASGIQYSPVSVPATSEHHAGKVVWLDLVTSDVDAAKRFYSGVFGWTFQSEAGAGGSYALALVDGNPVAGIFHRDPPRSETRKAAWLTFIAVGNVDTTLREAVAHGARVLHGPTDVPLRGRQAVFADPEGAVFAVIASSSGDPPDVLAPPGDWIWSSLLVRDPDREVDFYQSILGYEAFDIDAADGKPSVILSSDEFARASVNLIPAGTAQTHPHWLNFVRVISAANTSTRVVELGGKILVPVHKDRHGGSVAVVSDPAGAPFGILEWDEADGLVAPK